MEVKKTITIDLNAGEAHSNIDVRDMNPLMLKSGLDRKAEASQPRANQVYAS